MALYQETLNRESGLRRQQTVDFLPCFPGLHSIANVHVAAIRANALDAGMRKHTKWRKGKTRSRSTCTARDSLFGCLVHKNHGHKGQLLFLRVAPKNLLRCSCCSIEKPSRNIELLTIIHSLGQGHLVAAYAASMRSNTPGRWQAC